MMLKRLLSFLILIGALGSIFGMPVLEALESEKAGPRTGTDSYHSTSSRDELMRRIDVLERLVRSQASHLSLLRARVKRLEEGQPQPSIKTRTKLPVAQKTQTKKRAKESYKLSQLLPISSSLVKKVEGAIVIGEVWIWREPEVGADVSMTRFTGRYPAGNMPENEIISCVLDVPSKSGLRIRQWDKWRIQGTVHRAKLTQTGKVLELYLVDVQGTRTGRLDLGGSTVRGGFRAPQ